MSSIDLSRLEHLKATGDLPSPKGAALAIVRQTQKENCALPDLARAAKFDPAFVGRLIKAANLLHAGGRRPIVSIPDALMVLGIPAVRSLALGFSLVPGDRDDGEGFDHRRFWSRSLLAAHAFEALSLRSGAVAADEAFSVGLLAHIGQLALATLFPEQHNQVLMQAGDENVSARLELEQQAFSLNRNELSAAMLADWGLPRVFTDPVCFLDRPELAGFDEESRQYAILWALSAASRIADLCLAADGGRCATTPELLHFGSRLSINAESLGTLCEEVARAWRESTGLLDDPAAPTRSFAELPRFPAAQAAGDLMPGSGDVAYGMRCLVVDDDASMRAILRSLLIGAGHEVAEAVDGRQGFEMALELEPQIMVVDWLMPEMDGLELTRALRRTKIGRNVYILILTGLDEDDKLVQAFEAGVDDFMTKPLKPRLLAARLRAGLRVVRLQHEIERDREEIRRFAAELAVTNRRVQEASLFDVLTGFPNRRYAIDRMKQEWAAATRNRRSLACMVVDLDDFKGINDAHGHEAGDALLQQSAEILKTVLRAQDIVCRTGGDEFLVLCPDTAPDAMQACAERLRKGVETWRGQAGTVSLRCTVSIGAAVSNEEMGDPDQLVREAEHALRQAKNSGRNRVYCAWRGE